MPELNCQESALTQFLRSLSYCLPLHKKECILIQKMDCSPQEQFVCIWKKRMALFFHLVEKASQRKDLKGLNQMTYIWIGAFWSPHFSLNIFSSTNVVVNERRIFFRIGYSWRTLRLTLSIWSGIREASFLKEILDFCECNDTPSWVTLMHAKLPFV